MQLYFGHAVRAIAGYGRADSIGSDVDRQNGKGIGIKCRNYRHGEIYLENDGKQSGKKELYRVTAGDQACE